LAPLDWGFFWVFDARVDTYLEFQIPRVNGQDLRIRKSI